MHLQKRSRIETSEFNSGGKFSSVCFAIIKFQNIISEATKISVLRIKLFQKIRFQFSDIVNIFKVKFSIHILGCVQCDQ